jgi:hypothetical protein
MIRLPAKTADTVAAAIPAPAPAPIYKALAFAGLVAPFLSHGAVIAVGTTAAESASTCSLRDAARAVAAPGSPFGGCAVADGVSNTVVFAANVVGTITYNDSMSFGGGVSFVPNAPLSVIGPGASTLAITCSPNVINSAALVVFSNTHSDVSISGLTVRDCASTGSSGGLELDSSYANTINQLSLSDVVIRGNSGSNAAGIGVSGFNNVTFTRVAIDSNIGGGGPTGGGRVFATNDIVVRDSTISRNSGNSVSGLELAGETVSVINTTVSGNQLLQNGAAIVIYSNGFAVEHSTIVRNVSANSTSHVGLAFSSGFMMSRPKHSAQQKALSAPAGINNTIACGNDGSDVTQIGGPPSPSSFNLVGSATPSAAAATVAACNGTLLNGWLGPLANNGGPTQTHALLDVGGNPAIGGGDPGFTGEPTDQRGPGFQRVAGGRTDIGAFELGASAAALPTAAVPATGGAALAGLSIALAALGMRRRQKKDATKA